MSADVELRSDGEAVTVDVDGDPALPEAVEAAVRRLVAAHGRDGRALLPALRLLREELGPLTDGVLRAATT